MVDTRLDQVEQLDEVGLGAGDGCAVRFCSVARRMVSAWETGFLAASAPIIPRTPGRPWSSGTPRLSAWMRLPKERPTASKKRHAGASKVVSFCWTRQGEFQVKYPVLEAEAVLIHISQSRALFTRLDAMKKRKPNMPQRTITGMIPISLPRADARMILDAWVIGKI